MASVRREPIVRLIFVKGMSVYSEELAVGWGVDTPALSAEGLNFSTSSRRILPLGPVPLTLARGIPRSRAIFLAMGVAKMTSPVGSSTLEVVGVGLGSSLGVSLGSGSFSSAFVGSG